MPVELVISGGQIGADIAGLRAARSVGIQTGGWMPLGFRALDGNHPEYSEMYGVEEHECRAYPPRTRANVESSDATVMFAHNTRSPGTLLTRTIVRELRKPYMTVSIQEGISRLDNEWDDMFLDWISGGNILTLNVAGNSSPWIEPVVENFLIRNLPLTNQPLSD